LCCKKFKLDLDHRRDATDATWVPSTRHGAVGAGPEEGHENDPRAGTPLLCGIADSWGCSAWRREGSKETLLEPLIYKGGL